MTYSFSVRGVGKAEVMNKVVDETNQHDSAVAERARDLAAAELARAQADCTQVIAAARRAVSDADPSATQDISVSVSGTSVTVTVVDKE